MHCNVFFIAQYVDVATERANKIFGSCENSDAENSTLNTRLVTCLFGEKDKKHSCYDLTDNKLTIHI